MQKERLDRHTAFHFSPGASLSINLLTPTSLSGESPSGGCGGRSRDQGEGVRVGVHPGARGSAPTPTPTP